MPRPDNPSQRRNEIQQELDLMYGPCWGYGRNKSVACF